MKAAACGLFCACCHYRPPVVPAQAGTHAELSGLRRHLSTTHAFHEFRPTPEVVSGSAETDGF
jgi:hypothetical protein